MVSVLTQRGELAVGLGHKLLQPLLKELIGSLGCGRSGGGGRTALAGGAVGVAVPVAGVAGIIVCPEIGAVVVPLGLRLQTLHGQIDFAVIQRNNHDLHILAFGQECTDIADVGVGYLGDMYHARLVFRQRNERAEVSDRFYLALKNCSNG